MKENRVVRQKAKNPSTSRGINAQRGERGNHDPRLDMIEETGKVKKENTANPISGEAVPGLKVEESGSIWSRKEFLRPKLMGAQKIVTKVEGTQPGGNDFLKKFAMAFKERDGSIGFSK